jgi:hypothetical protein
MSNETSKHDFDADEDPYAAAYRRFPKAGAKLRFKQSHSFPYTDMAANADQELTVGEVYTLKTIELASSWAAITLEEKPEMRFSLGYFDVLTPTGNA